MKILGEQKQAPSSSLLGFLEDCKPLFDDPAWVYGCKLLDEYLDKNNPQLKEWMNRRDVKCLSCKKYEIDNDPDINLGCDLCWSNECDMMDLSDKFYKKAQETVHLLSLEEIFTMRQEYIDATEFE